MKNIKTKSVNEKKSKNDGIRICVMRRIRPEYEFDVWIPALSPPNKLFNNYVIEKKLIWKQFVLEFQRTVLKKKKVKNLLNMLILLSKKQTITLLCGEKSAKRCHRRLLIEACEQKEKEDSDKSLVYQT